MESPGSRSSTFIVGGAHKPYLMTVEPVDMQIRQLYSSQSTLGRFDMIIHLGSQREIAERNNAWWIAVLTPGFHVPYPPGACKRRNCITLGSFVSCPFAHQAWGSRKNSVAKMPIVLYYRTFQKNPVCVF